MTSAFQVYEVKNSFKCPYSCNNFFQDCSSKMFFPIWKDHGCFSLTLYYGKLFLTAHQTRTMNGIVKSDLKKPFSQPRASKNHLRHPLQAFEKIRGDNRQKTIFAAMNNFKTFAAGAIGGAPLSVIYYFYKIWIFNSPPVFAKPQIPRKEKKKKKISSPNSEKEVFWIFFSLIF